MDSTRKRSETRLTNRSQTQTSNMGISEVSTSIAIASPPALPASAGASDTSTISRFRWRVLYLRWFRCGPGTDLGTWTGAAFALTRLHSALCHYGWFLEHSSLTNNNGLDPPLPLAQPAPAPSPLGSSSGISGVSLLSSTVCEKTEPQTASQGPT